MKPTAIHKLANSIGIHWDNDKNFMSWCEGAVGKRHLDDMTEIELLMIYTRLKNGKYPKTLEINV